MKEYIHQNIPLITSVARALIRDLFSGKGYVKRAEIIKSVREYHTKNGVPRHRKKDVFLLSEKSSVRFEQKNTPLLGGIGRSTESQF